MLKVHFLMAAALVIGAGASCSSPEPTGPWRSPEDKALMDEGRGYLARAKSAFNRGDFASVVEECTEALTLDKKIRTLLDYWEWHEWYARRADAWMGLKEYEKAAAGYDEAIYSLTSTYRVRIPGYQKKHEEALRAAGDAAVADAEKRLAEHPGSVQALGDHARALLRRRQPGDADAALKGAQKCIELEPKSPVGLWILGDVHFDRKSFPEAKEAYLRAEAVFPNGHALGLFRLALLAEREKDRELAYKLYTQALEAEDKRNPELFERWPNPEILGPKRRALALLQRGKDRLNRAFAAKKDESGIDDAGKEFDAAFEADPRSEEVCFWRIKSTFLRGAYWRIGRDVDALDQAKGPAEATTLDDYAWREIILYEMLAAYHEEKWKVLDERAVRATRSYCSGVGLAWFLWAVAAENLEKYSDAPGYLQRARSLDPSLPALRLPKSEAYWARIVQQAQAERQAEAAVQAEFLRREKEYKAQGPAFNFAQPSRTMPWMDEAAADNARAASRLQYRINAELRHETYYGPKR